ncbi:MAG: helix-turn-helix domain-containing protein [Chthoniobacteraceae bacterium]
MNHLPTSSERPDDPSSWCAEIFLEQLRKVNGSQFTLHVPQLRDHVMEHPGLHFHFTPELVIALKARSRFEFIHEQFTLEPGEMAIIPAGIPHREEVLPEKRVPFENLVISIYNQTVCVQHQLAVTKSSLEQRTEYFDTPKYQQLVQYLEEAAELFHGTPAGHTLGLKGFLMAWLSTLELTVRRLAHAPPVERLKISQVKRQVQEHLGDANLSVKWLASLLHCSPDYLSNLFHRETGKRLTTYINNERIKASMEMLRNTPMTVSEIAFAVGFENPGYFSRVFKQIAFKTPLDFRKSVERTVVELDGRPQAIYAAEV